MLSQLVHLDSTLEKGWPFGSSLEKSFAHAALPFVMMGNGVELPGLPVAVRAHAARRCQIKIHPQKPTTLAGGNPEKGIATLIVWESPKTRWTFFSHLEMDKKLQQKTKRENELKKWGILDGLWMFYVFFTPQFFWGELIFHDWIRATNMAAISRLECQAGWFSHLSTGVSAIA